VRQKTKREIYSLVTAGAGLRDGVIEADPSATLLRLGASDTGCAVAVIAGRERARELSLQVVETRLRERS
jgi:hypothetical protein